MLKKISKLLIIASFATIFFGFNSTTIRAADCNLWGASWGATTVAIDQPISYTVSGDSLCASKWVSVQFQGKGGLGNFMIRNTATQLGGSGYTTNSITFSSSDLKTIPASAYPVTGFFTAQVTNPDGSNPTGPIVNSSNISITLVAPAQAPAQQSTTTTTSTNATTTAPVQTAPKPATSTVPAATSPSSWFPIVPCGLNQQPSGVTPVAQGGWDYTQTCNQCLLILLGKNMIDFVFFGLVPILGTLLFLIAGFIILFNAKSGNANGVGTGRKIMTDTAIGIAIILSSWLITNFILKSIANPQVGSTPWYQIQCRTGDLKNLADATIPSIGASTTTGGTTASASSGTGATGTGSAQCLQAGLNLCQGSAPQGCYNTSCDQYAAFIAKEANGAATEAVLKAFAEVESSCNVAAATGTSYGLMQLTPPIPQIYASFCGVSVNDVNQAWLTNPANADASICIAAQWINSVAKSKCGSSIQNLYAGYNGGEGACEASAVGCVGQTSCSGGPMRKWECLYDDNAQTKCNGGTDVMAGFNQTRQGAVRALYCASNPGF